MCDPLTGILAAVGAASSLFGGRDKTPPPPPAVIPTTPTVARDPGADVKIGDGQTKSTATSTPDFTSFTEKRQTGKVLGGLGKGGLGL